MNLYRYRVVERITKTKIKNVVVELDAMYYLQRSVLGIMWTDIESFFSCRSAVKAYEDKTKIVEVKEQVVHPVKQKP